MLLKESFEVQSIVRGLRGQIQGLEDWGLSHERREGFRCRGAGGVLRSEGLRHTFLGHQDLAEDDGEQEKEDPLGNVGFLGWQLAPDHSRVENPSAAFSVPAGSVETRGRRHRPLRERVEGENLGTGAPPEFRAGGGSGGRGWQASHGVDVVARVAHSLSAERLTSARPPASAPAAPAAAAAAA